jgi:hypothetical protein
MYLHNNTHITCNLLGDFKKQDIFSPRRSTRPRKQSLRAQEYASASGRRQGNKLILSFTASESESDECEPSEKPSGKLWTLHVSQIRLTYIYSIA